MWGGLLPKVETQAESFVTENPEWDGRGIIVGILDTGIDPGAVGLQTTTNGLPKLIDCIDCTGSGDVTLSSLCKADDRGVIHFDHDVKIQLNNDWTNPSGEYAVGFKRIFELFPGGLSKRVDESRKKDWDKDQDKVSAAVHKALGETHADDTEAIDDLKAQAAQLKTFKGCGLPTDGNAPYACDCGPIYYSVVFFNGDQWVGALAPLVITSTTENDSHLYTVDFTNVQVMQDYAVAQEYGTFSPLDALNYCLKFYEDGRVLSIVVDAGAHASHVGGIVAAHHATQPELNGVAPGAQLVSLKIGDSRLGSMETGTGLVRALLAAVKCGCHIINMSYGEATSWNQQGYFLELAQQLVHQHGIIFVSSAGNNGPCLSTVGCPGGSSNAIMSVGAFVPHSLMTAAYGLATPVTDKTRNPCLPTETNFTWSSVGPAIDGDVGVSIMAPGGAVTCVPNWTLAKNQLMNGTSMSSPNACGCITLLLSAASANGWLSRSSPALVRRAVEQAAEPLMQVHMLGQGHGLIQVQRAWQYLSSYVPTNYVNKRILESAQDKISYWLDVPFRIDVNSERFSRGIYLRQSHESSVANNFKVQISPIFHDKKHVAALKVLYELPVVLKSTVSWVTCPQMVMMASAGKLISVAVDPRQLARNEVHTGMVLGFADGHEQLGPLFRIPVTVVRPVVVPAACTDMSLGSLSFSSGERKRYFLCPPPGCTYIDFVVKDLRSASAALSLEQTVSMMSHEEDRFQSSASDGASDQLTQTQTPASDNCSPHMIVLHGLQTFLGTPYSDTEKQNYLHLTAGSQHVVSMAVTAGVTLELCVARFWSTMGDMALGSGLDKTSLPSCEFSLQFRGVVVTPSRELCITGGSRVSSMVRLHSPLTDVTVTPVCKLDKWHTTISPVNLGVVDPLGERDILFDGTHLYCMHLEYVFEQTEAGDVIPRFPGLQGVLYESRYHAQFFMVYDSNKRYVGKGDAWPSKIKLVKGKYTVRLQVRSVLVAELEVLASMPMVLERNIKLPVVLSFFRTQTEACANVGKLGSIGLFKGSYTCVYAREPNVDVLPKGVASGDVLMGKATFLKNDDTQNGCGNAPGGYKVSFIVGQTKLPVAAVVAKSSKKKPTDKIAGKDGKKVEEEEDAASTVVASDETSQTAPAVVAVDNSGTPSKAVADLNAAVKVAALNYLKTLADKSSESFSEVWDAVAAECGDDVTLHQYALRHAVAKASATYTYNVCGAKKDSDAAAPVDLYTEVIDKANKLLSMHDLGAVAAVFGLHVDKADRDKDVEAAKESIVEAITAKCFALFHKWCWTGRQQEDKDEYDVAVKLVNQWDSSANDKLWRASLAVYKMDARWGLALKLVSELLSDKKSKKNDSKSDLNELLEERNWLLHKLGWSHILTNTGHWTVVVAKNQYSAF